MTPSLFHFHFVNKQRSNDLNSRSPHFYGENYKKNLKEHKLNDSHLPNSFWPDFHRRCRFLSLPGAHPVVPTLFSMISG